jgi:hypothetical protein
MFMLIYRIELEIDGFFVAQKEIDIKQYKAEEFYIFNQEKISNNIISNIIYEIKSGNDFSNLCEQIVRDYYFFKNLFEIYPNYNIDKFAIFGFLRGNINIKDILLHHNEEEKKLLNIPIPIILFRYNNSIFGENVFYEKPELAEIRELKYLVNANTQNMEKMEENLNKKIQNIDNKIEDKIRGLKDDLDYIKQKLNSKNESNTFPTPNNLPFFYPPQNDPNNNHPNVMQWAFPRYILTPFPPYQGNSNS